MNLPNGLTLSRIFLVPLIVAILLTEKEGWEKWAIILILGAAITDWLDGYLARRRNQVTTLGRLLDPIADKLLISAAFISLVQLRLAPAWMVVIIIGREFAVSGLRSIAITEGFTIDASKLGKFKMVSQVISITLLILARKMPGVISILAQATLWVVVLFALASMIEYFREFWSRIDERIKHRQRRRLKFLRRRAKGKEDTGPGLKGPGSVKI
ncbi:MAG: CDP-diacylglycerol--glycerol-3-phosphate 3-phosphatidyltransferase [Acidobacteria bacterium]|nr:CDP-diacylglycerol--glycerol-3-phosphate 3-phosphatidyltransferase [Acidobacteriota bacterium]MBI3657100.1 CDP-diacylglycerol--glycerol-3-phosphate 3-phosphatidyltransferase [Acidobacteriota bacterium]